MAYGLDFPPAWRIHPVFHVSNLKRFQRSKEFEREERSPSPMVVDGEEKYEVVVHRGLTEHFFIVGIASDGELGPRMIGCGALDGYWE